MIKRGKPAHETSELAFAWQEEASPGVAPGDGYRHTRPPAAAVA